ncbi:MAG: His/Gly/Thr/Pro-type tRNA ligase C-terminal domain-containing protein, partial [Alphaproteobacteria bacterium]|nr:His/Gly/Thr/Pro-type tRNA ligase C-terminal domain-containing protein [Alphaproteobacteria bacterium]
GREFLMKDNYSFDLDMDGARRSYNRMFIAYLRTFARMGLKAIPMRAAAGPIGGNLSHEFIVLAHTGESQVFCDAALLERDILAEDIDYRANLAPLVEAWTGYYAATDEEHDAAAFDAEVEASRQRIARGIEVGHIFYFGTKYSKAMGAVVTNANGEAITVEMGSYGIGVSRLVGTVIEASHDDAGIIWPKAVAPFQVGIVNLKVGDESCNAACESLYCQLSGAGVDVLYDDRDERAGVKFATMELIGLPWQLVVGPRGVKNGTAELKARVGGEAETLSLDVALARLVG